jgi:hypothetical protein
MPSTLCNIPTTGEFASCSDGRKNDAAKPATIPPNVISSGMMKCSKSMNVAQSVQREKCIDHGQPADFSPEYQPAT